MRKKLKYDASVKDLPLPLQEIIQLKDNSDLGRKHQRFYRIAGITIKVESDLPFEESTFSTNVRKFEVQQPGRDFIHVSHHFFLPDLEGKDFGPQISGDDWFQIYRRNGTWIYISFDPPHTPMKDPTCIRVAAFFNESHTRGHVYHRDDSYFRTGNSNSLFFLSTDQVFISLLLADREGCYLHSSGVDFYNNGFAFLGHSGAGKSTIVKMLKTETELLCDDRIIIRKWPEGFKIHGTWSHGEISHVSPGSVFLRAILFIKKDKDSFLVPMENRKEIFLNLMENLAIPAATSDWWGKIFNLFDKIISEIPCYMLHFNKTGDVVRLIRELCE